MLSNLPKIKYTTICCNSGSSLAFVRHLSDNVAKHYDIVIAGGGMVGTTLACTLGKNKKLTEKKILLLEASKNKPWSLPDKYSNRVVSLNPGTQSLLSSIGVWKNIEKSRFATVKRLQVWDALSDTSITFGQPELTETVSYIVENDLLLAAVAEETKNCPNVTVQYDAKVKDYKLPEYSEKNAKIQLENGDEYTCDLLKLKQILQNYIRF